MVISINRETVLIGIVISILFFELTDVSPAGLISSGYLVLYLKNPKKTLYTLAISFISYFIFNKISKFMILYGRRRFTVMVIISFSLDYFFANFLSLNIGIIGFSIPAIIASDFDRQGHFYTLTSLGITISVMILITMIFNN